MEVNLLTYDDLIWPLGQQDSSPRYEIGCGTHRRAYKVDPYPCYAHDAKMVQELADECETIFPLTGARTAFYLLSHEDVERVNGTTFSSDIYLDDPKKVRCQCGCDDRMEIHTLATFVALSGKRTPIHPGMTRYLVSHEYGHMVWNYVTRLFQYHDSHEDKLYAIYMKTRGVADYINKYKGANWHINPGEIVANDFRLIFTNYEREFWPHPGIPYPEETPIVDWWREVHEKATGELSTETESAAAAGAA